MRENTHFRRYEGWFILGTAILYVIRRLLEEIDRVDGIVGSAEGNGVSPAIFWRDLASYNHTLNNNIPLIVGVGLFLMAWYVFHNLAYPQLKQRIDDPKALLYGGATVLLLLASVTVYHYLKLHVDYRKSDAESIIGLKVISYFRKRTVLADTIGLGIVLGAYELIFQYYQYLARKIAQEAEPHFRVISYLVLGGMCLLILTMAFDSHLPPTLFRGGIRDVLFVSGLVLQIVLFQGYFFTSILPHFQTSDVRLLIRNSVIFLVIGLIATTVFLGAVSNFYFPPVNTLLPYVFIVWVGAISIAYLRLFLTKEKKGLQTQVAGKSAELASLRAQINPHFLFNALNSLYATALKENSEKTADGIQKLGDMMRFMLQENNHDRIPLDKEIEYLRNYIQLQRMRIDDAHNIDIRVIIQEPTRALFIAPMMLTPFVENAFKYGISLRHASWITITLTLDDTRLYFKVHNSRHPKTPDRSDPEENQSGVGIDNVRKRLDLIYPGQHQLTLQQSDQDYFVSLMLVYS